MQANTTLSNQSLSSLCLPFLASIATYLPLLNFQFSHVHLKSVPLTPIASLNTTLGTLKDVLG